MGPDRRGDEVEGAGEGASLVPDARSGTRWIHNTPSGTRVAPESGGAVFFDSEAPPPLEGAAELSLALAEAATLRAALLALVEAAEAGEGALDLAPARAALASGAGGEAHDRARRLRALAEELLLSLHWAIERLEPHFARLAARDHASYARALRALDGARPKP